MAIRLLATGERRFAILEKGAEVGGTWRDNSYPGAECDVQSHLYSYSFAGKPDWSQRYAGWREIQQYILDTTERYGVRPYIRFNQQVTGLHFDPDTARWRVIMASGLELRARHVVLATGPLHVPNLPRLPGLDRFAGKVFHSAQWDHGYDLAGKRIASIGTGGSAIQYCPRIAPAAAQVHVFQRTPAWVIPRDVRTYSAGRRSVSGGSTCCGACIARACTGPTSHGSGRSFIPRSRAGCSGSHGGTSGAPWVTRRWHAS